MPPDADVQAGDRREPAPAPAVARAQPRFPWWLTVLVLAADQATKAVVSSALQLYESRTIIPGMLEIVHVRNTGVAFGFLHDLNHPLQSVFTTGLAVLALLGIAYYARHLGADERLARVGLSLILGGALGNLIDRVRHGFVVDFVDAYWGDWHFWAFNVADAAITIGAILVFIDLLVLNRHVSHPV